jgi:integrase
MARQTNIRRRENAWRVYFRVNGRQVSRSFKTRDEAELYLTQAKAELARGEFRRPVQVRFDVFAAEWLESHPSIDSRTRVLYAQRIRDYLTPVLGQLRLAEIQPDDVRRVKERAARAGRSGWTQKGILTLLSGILTYAVEQRLIASNPVAILPKRDRPKTKEGGRGRKRILSSSELRALLEHAGRHRAMFAVAAYAGLRISEVLGLTWEDIDFDEGTIHVHKQLSVPNRYDRAPAHRVDLKSDSDEGSDRRVFLHDDLARLLREHRGDRIRRRDEYVFVTSTGTPFSQRNVGRAFDAAVAAAVDDDARPLIEWSSRDDKPTFHSLRHTFASAVIAGGADQGHVARLLGHTDPSFTYKTYVHEFDKQRRQAESKAALGVAYAGVLA